MPRIHYAVPPSRRGRQSHEPCPRQPRSRRLRTDRAGAAVIAPGIDPAHGRAEVNFADSRRGDDRFEVVGREPAAGQDADPAARHAPPIASRCPIPSRAVGRPPEVSTRSTPSSISDSRACSGSRRLVERLVEGHAHRPGQLDQARRSRRGRSSRRGEGVRGPRRPLPAIAPSRCRIASRPARPASERSLRRWGESAREPGSSAAGKPRRSSRHLGSCRRPIGCRTARRGRHPPARRQRRFEVSHADFDHDFLAHGSDSV